MCICVRSLCMPSVRYPQTIRSGSVTTRVYRLDRSDGRQVFTAAWTVGGKRFTRQFASAKDAEHEARLKAQQLAAGKIDVAASMTGDDLATLSEARRLVGDVPLLEALGTWAKARELAGEDILRACEHWKARTSSAGKGVTVADAVKRFTTYKKTHERVNVEAGYARTLPGLVTALGEQPLAAITPEMLDAYLGKFTNAGSRNSHRTRIVTLFRWARMRGLLPLDIVTAAERTAAAREHRVEIGLVTAEQLRRAFELVSEKAPKEQRARYIAALALAAFAGLRRAEVHGQDWRDIDLDRALVRVTAAKPNTPARRLIPLGKAAVQWLTPVREKSGPVCTNLAIDRIRDICRTAHLDLADNGLRHSFISARVGVTSNVPEVALEAGNSPAMIFAHYRELLRKDEAEAWFSVFPPASAGNVVQFKGEVAS